MNKTTINKKLTQTFHYKGVHVSGPTVTGVVSAPSVILAKVVLGKQGIHPLILYKKRQFLKPRISAQALSVLTHQLATMIEAGIPLVQTFGILSKGQHNKHLQQVIATIQAHIEAGGTLTHALEQHPRLFNPLFCNLVHAGEQSGTLDLMLEELANYTEKVDALKKKLKQALTYPMAIVFIAALVCLGLFIVVIPQFEALFKGFGADLPLITRMVIRFSRGIQWGWHGLVIGLCVFACAFHFAQRKSLHFVQQRDKLLLTIPLIGPIIKKAAIARFARTFAITFAAGIPVVEALKSVSGATGNSVYSKATDQIQKDLILGLPIHVAIKNTQVFPHKVIQMIAIGEESGRLDYLLSKIASWYERDVDTAINTMSSLLEPLIMVILGVLVGVLVMAMYLPIFKLSSVI